MTRWDTAPARMFGELVGVLPGTTLIVSATVPSARWMTMLPVPMTGTWSKVIASGVSMLTPVAPADGVMLVAEIDNATRSSSGSGAGRQRRGKFGPFGPAGRRGRRGVGIQDIGVAPSADMRERE